MNKVKNLAFGTFLLLLLSSCSATYCNTATKEDMEKYYSYIEFGDYQKCYEFEYDLVSRCGIVRTETKLFSLKMNCVKEIAIKNNNKSICGYLPSLSQPNSSALPEQIENCKRKVIDNN